jgi:hypothetical protein
VEENLVSEPTYAVEGEEELVLAAGGELVEVDRGGGGVEEKKGTDGGQKLALKLIYAAEGVEKLASRGRRAPIYG